jgi:hypothetical protein
MPRFAVGAAGFGAALLAAAAPVGPDRGQFSAAWQAFVPTQGLEIRRLKCRGIAEDPSEFACRFERRVDKRWQRWATMVARDGSGWVMIDAPGPVPLQH